MSDTFDPSVISIGQRVTVTLEKGTVTGRLLRLDRGGEVLIEPEFAGARTVGPVLDIQRVPACGVMYPGEFWPALPCERAPNHGSHHVDCRGRSW